MLPEQRVQGGEAIASTGKDQGVGHFITPADAKDPAKASHVETVQLLLMLGLGCPSFAPIMLQEGANDAGVVHCNLRKLEWSACNRILSDMSGQ